MVPVPGWGVIVIFPPPRLYIGDGERVPAVLLCSEPGRLSEVMLVVRVFVKERETLKFGVL